jgi:hypothetical protein
MKVREWHRTTNVRDVFRLLACQVDCLVPFFVQGILGGQLNTLAQYICSSIVGMQ